MAIVRAIVREMSCPEVSNEELRGLELEQNLLRECVNTSNSRYWQRNRRIALVPNLDPAWTVLRYVGGADLSSPKNNQTEACAALVVIAVPSLKVVYKDFIVDHVGVPYIPGFLGAREYPLISRLLERLRQNSPEFFPQVLLIDGNGILHPRRCGSACYVGVKEKIPCVGVAKTFYRLPQWPDSYEHDIRKQLFTHGDSVEMMHDGAIVGKALIASRTSKKPVFVSVGHDIDLETAVWVVMLCSKYRVSEPVRQADLMSRQIISNLYPADGTQPVKL